MPALVSGTVIEALDIERLVAQYSAEIRSLAKNENLDSEAIAEKLNDELTAKGVKQRVVAVDDMHLESSEASDSNVDIWFTAETLAEARAEIQEVSNHYLVPFIGMS